MRVAFRSLVLLVVLSLAECFSGPARAQEPAQMLQQGLGSQFMVFRDKVQERLRRPEEEAPRTPGRLH